MVVKLITVPKISFTEYIGHMEFNLHKTGKGRANDQNYKNCTLLDFYENLQER